MNNENVEQESAMLPDGGGDGITPQEFAQKIKAKYPEYKGVDDVVLARKMVEKYPEYKNKVSFGTPDQPKKALAVKSGASQSASAAGDSLSALPRPKTTLIQRMQEDQMSRPKVGQEQAPVNQINNRVKEDIRKDQKTWSSNKPVAQKVSQALKPAPENPTEAVEPSYATNSVENYVDRHSKDYKYDHDYYKTVSNEELTKVTDNFDGTSVLGISDRDFANYLKNKTNYFNSDIKYDSEAQEQFAINEYVNGYMADRANYLKDKFVISNPESRNKIIKESEVLSSQYEKYKKEVTPEYYKLEQDKKAKNKEFYDNVKKGKNFLADAEATSKSLVKGATFALADLVSSAADITGFDNYADKLRFEKKFIDWSQFDQGTVTYAKGKSVNYKGNDYIVTSIGNIVDKDTKTSINTFANKSDIKNILTAAEDSKEDDSVYSGRGYTYALANTVGNLAFQILATKGVSGTAAKVGLTEANVGKIAATAPEMVTVGSMVGSSTFNDTLEQLRKAGIPDDIAKGEASKIAAFTAAAGMIVTKFLPNTHANKILSSELNTPELIKQTVNIFRNEGSQGVSEFLKTGARDVILKSGSVAKEGFGEMLQELSENSAQKQGNYWTNAKLDKNVLNTAWTKQEILDTAILSFAAGGGMGAIGKTRQGFLGTNVQENFDILSALDSSKLGEQGQILVDAGNLSQPEFDMLKTQIQNYKAYKNKLADDIKGKTAVEATQLMAERDKLKQDKKNLDEAFHPEIDAKIEVINSKISETLANKESAPEQTTQEQQEETKPVFNENIETPEGFTNRVHNNFVQLGSPSENSHITEEGYTYRTVGDGEVQAIAETGGVFSREGKQKGGNPNTKYWTKGNGRNYYDVGRGNTIRVADANIDPNKVVSANDLEILTDEGFVPFSEYIKQQNNEQTTAETNAQPEANTQRTEGETNQGKTEGEEKITYNGIEYVANYNDTLVSGDTEEEVRSKIADMKKSPDQPTTKPPLIKDEKVLTRLREAGVGEDVISALPENFHINDKWLMGTEGESLLERLGKTLMVAGQAFSVTHVDEKGKIVKYDNGRVDMNKLGSLFSEKGSKQTLHHEVVHTATVLIMDDMKRSPENYTKEELDALSEIEFNQRYYNDLYKEGYKLNPDKASLYGLTNPYEFVAEFMANKGFREWILNKGNQIKTPINTLQKIWENIKTILGFSKNKREFDNEALNDIQSSINMLVKKTRDKYNTDKTNEKEAKRVERELGAKATEIDSRRDAELDKLEEPLQPVEGVTENYEQAVKDWKTKLDKYNSDFEAIDAKYDAEIDALKTPKTEVFEGASDVHKKSKELSEIGTDQEYKDYLQTVFPETSVKDVVHHLTKHEFDNFERNPDVRNKIATEGFHFIEPDAVEGYKHIFGENVKDVILDLRNPVYTEYNTNENHRAQKLEYLSEENLKNFEKDGYDSGVIVRKGETEYIAFHPEQIHVLGSKQDIEGFRNWKNANTDINKLDLSDQLGLNKINDILNNWDDKLKGFGNDTLGMNLPLVVARGAIAAMKAAVKGAKIGADVISAGVNYVKSTDWYNNLDAKGKAQFDEDGLIKSLNDTDEKASKKAVEAAVKSEINDDKKSTKATVREVTGQTDTSNKVSTTEAKLLKEKYKNLQRGYKQGVKETQQLKREFVDYVKENIDQFSEHLTKNEVNRLLNMVGNINENNVDKVTNVIDNIVERLEGRADKAKLSSIAKLQQKANKKYKNVYGSNYVKIRNLTKIDPLFLPKGSVDTYHSLMTRLAKGEAVDISEVNRMAESLKDEINDYVDYKNQIKSVPKTENPEKRENAKNEVTIASGAVKQAYKSGKFNSLSEGAKGIVRQFLTIPSAYLETLTAPELSKITKALDYLGASGQLSNAVLSDVVSKYNARQNAQDIRGKVGDRVLKSVGTYTQKIATLLGKKNFSAKDFENGIANTMLQHVDTVVKGLKGTTLYDKLIHPITSNLTKASNQTAEVSKELTALFSKAVGKGNQFDTNAKLQMFFRQKEFEANPSLHGDKVFSLDEHIAETLKNKNNSNYDEDSLNAVEQVYKKMKGKSAEEMYDEMTPDEQKLINKMEETIKNIGVKSKNYNDHIVGETPLYLESFFPRRNDNYNKKGDKDILTFHSNGAPSITSNSSNDRTANKATPLNFNTIGNLLNYVKEANIESNLGQNLKEVRMTLSDLKNSDSESLVKLSNALESSVNNDIKYQLQAGIQNYDGKLDRAFNSLQRNTYKRVLVDFIKRLPVDIISNYVPVYMTYADRLPAMYKASSNMNPEVMTKMFENISSTQMDRLLHDGGAHSADYKSADSSNTSQYKYNKSNPSFGETFIDLMNHNKLGDFSEELNKLYYKLADKPAVHLWKLYMADEFKAVTGKEFNGEQYVNDAKYREDNNKVLQEIAKKADKMTSNLFNTSSTAERKLKVQAGNKDFLVRMNNFLRSFTNNEFKVFWDSLKGTTGIGETSFDSRAEAARAFAIVNTRGIMYSYLGSILGDILVNFAADDDDEIELINKKALEKSIAQHGMLIALGNSSSMTNLSAAFAIELLNRNVVESKGAKYSPFEDSYLFVPNEHSKPQDALNYLGAEGNATRVIYDSGEMIYKSIKKFQNNEKITLQDAIDLKSAQISMSLVAQTTGLPTEYLGKLSQKALKKKFSGDTDKKKWKGFGSFGTGSFGGFK